MSKSTLSPSLKEWKSLYEEAMAFKKLECWKWAFDSDIFGVQNPENGEIGYCCILGHFGEVFGLVMYLGTNGLEGYLKIQSGEIGPEDIDVIHTQKCLMVSFEDRNELKKADLQVIKDLGLKFRGRKEWPLFRNHQPGYLPWYLTRKDVIFLTTALQQTIEVSKRLKEDKNLLTPPKEGFYLARVPKMKVKKSIWEDKWLSPVPIIEEDETFPKVDEVRIQRIKKKVNQNSNTWEIDFFYSPFVIQDKERPYFPLICLFVDRNSSLIMGFHLSDSLKYRSEFKEKFLGIIEQLNSFPKEVMVKRKQVYDLFEPITRRFGTEIHMVETLEEIEEVKESMFEFVD